MINQEKSQKEDSNGGVSFNNILDDLKASSLDVPRGPNNDSQTSEQGKNELEKEKDNEDMDDILDIPPSQGNSDPTSNSIKPTILEPAKENPLADYQQDTNQMHEITANIHNRMDHLNDHGYLNVEQYNSLREKLSQVSEIYKKKYPNCLPLPLQVIDKDEELNEELEVQECKYSFHLGFNYVLNWLMIISPLKLE